MSHKTETRRVRKIRLLLILTMLIFALIGTTPSSAQADTFTSNENSPDTFVMFVPCAANGAGELVELSGNIHVLFHVTFDGRGGFHAISHFQQQGVSGIGLTTGDRYRSTWVTQNQWNGKEWNGTVGFENTFADNLRIIGPGPGNNFLVHRNVHITVASNGDVTTFVDNSRVECN
jgi:hypothetical protein